MIICLAGFLQLLIVQQLTAITTISKFKGVPLLKNITPEQAEFTGKVWGMSSTPNGLMYYATDSGLAEFDGVRWKLYKGSKGITRSVLAINDSVLYTGSDLDFGVWKKDAYQHWEYTSLYPVSNDSISTYEEFWYIQENNGDILFLSVQNLYLYSNSSVSVIPAKDRFSSSFKYNEMIYIGDSDGLYVFTKKALEKKYSYPKNQFLDFVSMYSDGLNEIAVTRNQGLFVVNQQQVEPLNTALSKELKNALVFSYTRLDDTHSAFGTVLNGLIISDKQGNVQHRISKNKGLLNNTILSLYFQNSGKLWIGLDYGLAYVDLSSDYTYVFDYAGQFGSASTAILRNNLFFLGTNQGLYVANWNSLDNHLPPAVFTLIPGSEGQVWTLQYLNNSIYVGHDKGLFLLDEKKLKVTKLSDTKGIWSLETYGDVIIAGTYSGISIFDSSGEGLKKRKDMELISGSCNQLLVQKDSILWVNIPNFGVIKATLNADLVPVKREIFKTEIFAEKPVFLKHIDGKIIAETDSERYVYSEEKQEFMWLEHQPRTMPGISSQPGLRKSVQLTESTFFYPLYNGIAFYTNNKPIVSAQDSASLVIRHITAFSNQNEITIKDKQRIPSDYTSLRVEVSVPFKDRVTYQIKLGQNGVWKSFITNKLTVVDLPFGDNELVIQPIRNERIIATTKVRVFVESPWYNSQLAWFLYVIGLTIVILIAVRVQQVILKKQKQELLVDQEKKLQDQAKKHEQVLLQLEKERLKEEVADVRNQLKAKTIELANKAKENEEKNRLLQTIKEKFEQLRTDSDPLKMKWGEIQRLLNSYINMQDTTFEIQMDELHQEFFKKLKALYPGLSGNDLRLCAYIKLGLNSKEISDLLNILPSSVYISRSRLRKKLNLEGEEDLFDHLNSL